MSLEKDREWFRHRTFFYDTFNGSHRVYPLTRLCVCVLAHSRTVTVVQRSFIFVLWMNEGVSFYLIIVITVITTFYTLFSKKNWAQQTCVWLCRKRPNERIFRRAGKIEQILYGIHRIFYVLRIVYELSEFVIFVHLPVCVIEAIKLATSFLYAAGRLIARFYF